MQLDLHGNLPPSEANKAKIILATVQGVIKGVFVAEQWLEATQEKLPELYAVR